MGQFAKSGENCEKCRKKDLKIFVWVQDEYKPQDILSETLKSQKWLKDDAIPSQYLQQQGYESDRSKEA